MKSFFFTLLISATTLFAAGTGLPSAHLLLRHNPERQSGGTRVREIENFYPQKATPASRGGVEPERPEGAVDIKCTLQFNPEKYEPFSVMAYNKTSDAEKLYSETSNTVTLTLQPGKYDFMASFLKKNPTPVSQWGNTDNFILVIVENVEVSEGKEVIFDASRSQNRLRFSPIGPDGELLTLDHRLLTDLQTEETQTLTEGNIDEIQAYINVWHQEYGLIWQMFTDMAYNYSAETPDGGFYEGASALDLFVNNVSDKYRFSECQALAGKNNRTNLVALWAEGCKDQTVSNDPKHFHTFEPTFVRSPLSDQNYETGLAVWPKFGVTAEQGRYSSINISRFDDKLDKLDVCIPHGGDSQFTDLIYTFDYYQTESAFEKMWSPLFMEQDGRLISKFKSVLTENILIGPDLRGDYLAPGAKGVEYDASLSKPQFGGNTPVCNFTIYEMRRPGAPEPDPSVFHFYLGRAGEVRDIDRFNSTLILDIDGKEVASSLEDVWEWAYNCGYEGMTRAKHHFHLENSNVIVDGLPGVNITDVTFDKGNTDCWPPELRMVNFKDNNGLLTDRFARGSDGNLGMYGGDFNMRGVDELRENGWSMIYWTYAPADWKVEYAPYGDDSFSPLEVDERPEYFMFPAFGAFMQANLEQVTRKSPTGWFDLRVTLTDAAGNTQSQLISPAFKIEANVGLSTPDVAPEFSVTVDGNNIVCPVGAVVYNLAGQRVATTNLPAGVYLVTYSGLTTKVIVR